MDKIDYNSNFRKYYLNDHQFYVAVIKYEEGPYEFKLHLFLDTDSSQEISGKRYPQDYQEHLDSLYGKLKDLGAEHINDAFMPERRRKSDEESDKKKHSSDKIRFLFTIAQEKEALEVYKYFHRRAEIQNMEKRGRKLLPKGPCVLHT